MKGRISHTLPPHAERFFARKRGGETAAPYSLVGDRLQCLPHALIRAAVHQHKAQAKAG